MNCANNLAMVAVSLRVATSLDRLIQLGRSPSSSDVPFGSGRFQFHAAPTADAGWTADSIIVGCPILVDRFIFVLGQVGARQHAKIESRSAPLQVRPIVTLDQFVQKLGAGLTWLHSKRMSDVNFSIRYVQFLGNSLYGSKVPVV